MAGIRGRSGHRGAEVEDSSIGRGRVGLLPGPRGEAVFRGDWGRPQAAGRPIASGDRSQMMGLNLPGSAERAVPEEAILAHNLPAGALLGTPNEADQACLDAIAVSAADL